MGPFGLIYLQLFSFLFLENSLILSTHQQESSRLVWTVIFLFQPNPPVPSSSLQDNLEIIFRSSLSCLFIYLKLYFFFVVVVFFLPLPCSVIIIPSKMDLLFFLFFFWLKVVVGGGKEKEGKYRIFDV